MITIRIVAVGTLKEKFFVDAVAEYVKRLGRFCKLEIVQIRESDPKQECGDIRRQLRGHVALCAIDGELVTSEGLAAKLENLSQVTSCVTFVIGGSDGVGNHLEDVVAERISLGRITLPHQLFRVVLVEQVYRAFSINSGAKYHK